MCNKEMDKALCSQVNRDDPLTGTTEQWRCKVCNALKSRIKRICGKDKSVAKDFAALEPKDRKELIQQGGMQIHTRKSTTIQNKQNTSKRTHANYMLI